MIVIDEPVTVTKAMNSPDVSNPDEYIVTVAEGAVIRWPLYEGVRMTVQPSWIVVEPGGYLIIGEPPPPPVLVNVNVDLNSELLEQKESWWAWTRDYFVTNPACTQAEYVAAFVAVQGSTVYYSSTFLPLVMQLLNEKIGQENTFIKFRDWVVANNDAEDMGDVF